MKLFNTLSQTKEEFSTSDSTVSMYVCGITPYDSCHLGHAMSYIIFDVIRRYMEFQGHQVLHVQNFTDIDDKIIDRSKQMSIDYKELGGRYIEEFFSQMDSLNILRAHNYPRATEEIPDIIQMIQGLTDKGFAYTVNGNVYFRVTIAKNYGKLGHRSLDQMIAGSRVQVVAEKEHPMDFALWKTSKDGEPSWDSPWGPGRPGWHIECSAMALKFLGNTIDIHGGGHDLIFPHHENEIAQSESYIGNSNFVRYWVHNGLLQLGDEKMSKSVGNLISIREALAKYSPDAIRLFVLSSHYRNPLTYTEEALEGANRGAERLSKAANINPESTTTTSDTLDVETFVKQFYAALDDDFNTPQAIGSLFDLVRTINKAKDKDVQVGDAQITLRHLASLLGLTLHNPANQTSLDITNLINLLIDIRTDLRSSKQFALADTIRDRLEESGVILEDTDHGTSWQTKI